MRRPESPRRWPRVTLSEARKLACRRLRAAGIDSAETEAVTLLEAATGLTRSALLMQPERPLQPAERLALLQALRRRAAREPLQHILGRAPFYGLELDVDADVMVPRPETERLVELVLARLAGVDAPRLLDVGCGSGAVALALKAERPDADVMASDVDPAAVLATRRNAERLRLAVTVRHSDLLAAAEVAAFAASCQALVANLPYLPAADADRLQIEARHDPHGALFAGADGLALARRLLGQAYRLLPRGALLALELDPRNVRQALREAAAWASAGVERDLTGRERFLMAVR